MTFEKIQQIYPTAHFSNTPIDDPNFYCIRLEEGFAILRTSMLTNNERSLLQLLENPVKEPKNAPLPTVGTVFYLKRIKRLIPTKCVSYK